MLAEFVNLSDYPIDKPESDEYHSLVKVHKGLLQENGMINLENFLTAMGVKRYRQEIDERMSTAFHAVTERHPYGYYKSDDLPDDHPSNTFSSTQSFRLARHLLLDTKIDDLYTSPMMRNFIADITGHKAIYLSGDPSNGLVVQVYKEGCGQAWHFDQALFSTIINLGESTSGGVFECVPNIRTEDEPNYSEVKSVLDNRSERIQKHHVKAGSFTVMLGRYTIHRVTTIENTDPRISAVLSYELKTDVHMDIDTRLKSFGPTAPLLP